MPHLPRFVLKGHVYHTISATRNREAIFEDTALASILQETIEFIREDGRALILAYAILPDHVHLLMAPTGDNTISDLMRSIKRYSVKRINELTGRSGSLWQQSFYDRVIRDEKQLQNTIDYIHQNPVVAGLATSPAAYAFSSAASGSALDLQKYFSG